jgi:predicted ArsR family transcriptional regulator
MFLKTLRDLARPQIVAIIDILKRSEGLAVGEIAEKLKMSYMGVKQYCIELEKRGYLDTWRRAKETGRPELTYRLTEKAQMLFPQHSNELSLELIEAVRQLHGPTAVEKILYQYFVKKADAYAKRLKGQSLAERASSLAKLRDAEGHCAQVECDPGHGLRLTEYHSPLAELARLYPSVGRMEESMISRLLQAPVQREASEVSGLMRMTYLLAGATLPPPPAPASGVRSRPSAHRKARVPAPSTVIQSLDPVVSMNGDEPRASEQQSIERESLVQESVMEMAQAIDSDVVIDVPVATSEPAPEITTTISGPVAAAKEAPAVVPNEPLLFDSLQTIPPPRSPTRVMAPPRTVAKSAGPVVEELFLSL